MRLQNVRRLGSSGAATSLRRVGMFVLRTYVPADDDFWVARQAMKADLAWQPYLYTAVFFGAMLTMIVGDSDTVPPVDRIDATWLVFGVLAPAMGFVASLMVRIGHGQVRYSAFWLRVGANVGLIAALLTHQVATMDLDRLHPMSLSHDRLHPMSLSLMVSCLIFLVVLIAKDLHFLVVAERVAQKLRD